MNEIYLGDGAYAKYNGVEFTLYTHNGIHPTNSVVLERPEMQILLDFLKEQLN